MLNVIGERRVRLPFIKNIILHIIFVFPLLKTDNSEAKKIKKNSAT